MTTTPYNSTHTGQQVDTAVDRANISWLFTTRFYDGTFNLTAGNVTDEVEGLGLDFLPVRGFLTVESPVDGFILMANITSGTFSKNGFQFGLSGAPDVAGYKLHYFLLGNPSSDESGSNNSAT